MGWLKDSIDIGAKMDVPNPVLQLLIVIVATSGITWFTARYVINTNIREAYTNAELTRLANSVDALTLKVDKIDKSVNTGFEKAEKAIIDESNAIKETSDQQMDLMGKMAKFSPVLWAVYNEKQSRIAETQKQRLPHLNGFHIGVTPKTN